MNKVPTTTIVFLVIVSILICNFGCGSSDGNGAQNGVATIGSSGGSASLSTDEGTTTVYFAKGAVDSDVSVEINAKEPVTGLPEELRYASEYAYDITCSATTFHNDIAISLPLTSINPELMYAIVTLNNGNWEYIGGSIDQYTNTITATIDHLSEYAVVVAEGGIASSECDSYEPVDCQNAEPIFEFENDNVSVYSINCSVVDANLEEVITNQVCSTALSYALGGKSVPQLASIVGLIAGVLDIIMEQYDPVRIAPFTSDVDVVEEQVQGDGLLDPNHVSAIVFLDFAGTHFDRDRIDSYRR